MAFFEKGSALDNAIIQYFNNIEWCMKRDMNDGIDLLLNNIPPYIIPYVYLDVRSCKLILLGHMMGKLHIVEKIINKLIYPSFHTSLSTPEFT